jgi:arylsulfatase A-like enzyme
VRSRRVAFAGSVLFAVAMVAGVVAVVRKRPPQPNVILVVLDTLRADRVGEWNRVRPPTPFLDEFAAASIAYERAYAPGSWTVPTIASLFLAQYPSEHQVVTLNSVLPYDALTLAEVLSQHGYVAGGFWANFQVAAESGFGQGFDQYRTLFQKPKVDGSQLNRAALDWVEYVSTESRPFFLYLQYMEPHAPYRFHAGITVERQPDVRTDDATLGERLNLGGFRMSPHNPMPSEWAFSRAEHRRLIELYDGEVVYLDGLLRQLFSELGRRGRLDNTLIVMTADHGEEFGEHGMYSHGVTLFEPGIRIPLLIRLPGTPAPRHIVEPVNLAGLAPALLGHLGLGIPSSFRVEPLPLEPAVNGAVAVTFSESADEGPKVLRLHQRAVVGQAEKMLVQRDGEHIFYDLASDPGEAHPVPSSSFARELEQALIRFASALGTPAERVAPPVDEATRARLRALGYGGG